VELEVGVVVGQVQRVLGVAAPQSPDERGHQAGHGASPLGGAPLGVGSLPMNRGRKASPSAPTPWRPRTRRIVIARIFKSSRSEWWSTYQVSSSNFSSQLTLLRPITWAQPVIPGRTSWRRACSAL